MRNEDGASESRRTPTLDPLAGGGDMGAQLREVDWARTPLGPVASWPMSLKTVVGVALGSRFPMLVWWGADLVQIYNDAYRPILGDKHPQSIAAPGAEVWREIWHIIGPMAAGIVAGGPATWSEHLLLPMDRKGFLEEAYFTFSYSPLPGDDGRIAGVLVTTQETTAQVQGERQLRTLRDLGTASAQATTAEDVCLTAARILATDDADVPFALLYLVDPGRRARLVATAGLGMDDPRCPAEIRLDADAPASPWPLAAIRDEPLVLCDLETRCAEMPRGHWPAPPHSAVVQPLLRAGGGNAYGYLVAGASAGRVLDPAYLGFFRLLGDQIAAAIGNARAHEEERRRAEALAELDRAKTAFFSNISHEFRTPLSLTIGPLEDALARGDGLAGNDLELAYRSTLRLLKLVNSLLDFARIEAGRARASYRPTDLAAVTADHASQFRAAFERAGLVLDVDCPALSAPVWVDREMWETVVMNLLSNAIKFTFEGGVTVRLREDDDAAVLVVSDTGVGVSAEERPRLFERFHRAAPTRSRTHEGTGIGLALVHEIVRLHGGRIEVASELERGTTFTVTIPRGHAHLPPEHVNDSYDEATPGSTARAYVGEAMRWLSDASPEIEPRNGVRPLDGARVLVVEDNADMRAYLERILSEHWPVTAVADGRSALERVHEEAPDLVVTDVMMPGLDGFGLLRALRANPGMRDIRVIMLSARAGEDARVEGLSAGADDYLVKPFSAAELVARVAQQLSTARARKTAEAQRRTLYELFMQAPDPICVLGGHELVFEMANDAYRALSDDRELLGKRLLEAMPELAGQGYDELMREVLRTGRSVSLRGAKSRLRRDGKLSETVWDSVYAPLRDASGTLDRVMVLAHEITHEARARAELEEARRHAENASRAKDEFLAMLGHELRNPLAPIVTATELMDHQGGNAFERERAVIRRQLQHVVRLVDDLLDVSRITRGSIALERKPVEMSVIAAKAIEQVSPLITQRRHALSSLVPANGLLVHGDETRLAQVLANLLANAAKYTPTGGRIAVTGTAEGDDVRVTVRDNGVGISPGLLPHVFELFKQGEQGIDRARGGLGLGLAIAKAIVELHGGRITATSAGAGRGSEFSISLPRMLAVPRYTPEPVAESFEEARSRRVLVVDDNLDLVETVAELISCVGHDVTIAHDGLEAWRRLADEQFEVAVLDIGLPGLSGYELVERIRADDRLRSMHVIALTGYGGADARDTAMTAGFDAYLVKPVDLGQLRALIANGNARVQSSATSGIVRNR